MISSFTPNSLTDRLMNRRCLWLNKKYIFTDTDPSPPDERSMVKWFLPYILRESFRKITLELFRYFYLAMIFQKPFPTFRVSVIWEKSSFRNCIKTQLAFNNNECKLQKKTMDNIKRWRVIVKNPHLLVLIV